METNDSGQVAIKRLRMNQKLVYVGDIGYVFIPKNNINLAWINPEHVNSILGMKESCCGGNKKPAFFIALEHDVRRWQFGGR